MRIALIRMLGVCALLCTAVFPAAAWKLPMYQLFSSTLNDYLYTTSESERADAIAAYGYEDDGIAYYVDDGSSPAVTPLYRFYKGPPQTDHFYTHDTAEYAAVVNGGWAYEGIQAWVFAGQAAGTARIYRLSLFNGNTWDLKHYYTSSYAEAQQLVAQGWGLDSTAFYAFTTGNPAVPTPRMVHATQLTASCADKYCVKITGFDFAPDAYIEMRSGSANGPIIWNEANYVRGTSGIATTLEVVLTNPGVRSTLDHPAGIWFYVVNPGNPGHPTTRGGGFNVIRDTPYSLRGYVDVVDNNGVQGWLCTDRDYHASLQVTVRLDSDSGEIVATGYTLPHSRQDAAYLCGGVAAGSMFINWPSRYLDGRTRDVYVIGRFSPDGPRYPNALVNNSPVRYTFPNIPWDASGTIVPLTVSRGANWGAQLTFTNRGSHNWDSGGRDAVSFTQTTGFPWAPSSAGVLYPPVVPEGTATISVGGTAPSAPGTYLVTYRARHGASPFGASATVSLTVQ